MAGKGGTGKTTIAALLVRIIKEKELGSVLAVDADPNHNLGELLGVEVRETIGGIIDDISVNPQSVPANMGKDAFIEYRVQGAVIEAGGFDLLTMGRPEGPGCYCYVNNSLRNVMDKLTRDYDFVIIDNEAGLEHLSRRTTRRVDSLLVISDATEAGLRAANRIAGLTRELDIKVKNGSLIINRCGPGIEPERIRDLELDYLGCLPADSGIAESSRVGSSLMALNETNAVLNVLSKLGEKIWLCH